MKKLKNIKLEREGLPIVDSDTKQALDTLSCIRAVLNNCTYERREDQRLADKLYFKLDDIKGDEIELEDADFDLIKKYAVDYKPFLNGRLFVPFLDQLEE